MSDSIDFLVDDLKTEILDWVFDLTHKELIQETNDRIHMMDRLYQRFFQIIAEEFLEMDGDVDGSPGRIAGQGVDGSWKHLSDRWQELKNRMDGEDTYYSGITGLIGAKDVKKLGSARSGKTRAKNGFKRPPTSKVGPFDRFINKKARDSGAVNTIFGPLSTEFYFGAAGATMTPIMSDDKLKQVISKGAKGRFVTMPSRFQMGSTITAFQGVQGVTFDEWHIIDFILKQRDPANEKQWVKINSRYGFGRTHRPVRAMISPLINWYMTVGLPNIIGTL